VFELGGVLYQPYSEPITRVSKKGQAATAAAVLAPPLKKAAEKWKRVKGSSHSGDQTSEQEKMLPKPLK
jgi:hypothetical protein